MQRLRIVSLIALACSPLTTSTAQQSPAIDSKTVDQALGRAGALQPGAVYKVGFPRSDLRVTVAGVTVRPALALGSWIALKPLSGGEAMLMGDLVLLDAEVEPVMARLEQGGILPTAVHNHLLHDQPPIRYMHIDGRGAPAALAATVAAALALTGTPPATPGTNPPPVDLDTATIARTLGISGKAAGGVYQVAVPRADTVRVDGEEIPPAMGMATAINFQSLGNGKAALTGDFVLIGSEVHPVLRALREGGIEITALHSHLIGETPRLFFMHFWGNADAGRLAQTLRAALDRMNVRGLSRN